MPSVLKTRRLGYDGKGQVRLESVDEAEDAWRAVGGGSLDPRIARAVRTGALDPRRSWQGRRAAFYPLVQNVHRDGILRVSIAPAPDVTPELQALAERHALAVMERLGHVGVLAIELFEVGEDLLGNEMAPRVHNSGHWTIEGAATSQFENHLRAICGLELGPTSPSAYSAMVNLIGSVPPKGSLRARARRSPSPVRQGISSRPEARPHHGHRSRPRYP